MSKRYGIATIANDRVIDWVLPFLESYRATHSATPLYIIPYDDNMARTRKAAGAFGVEVASVDSAELDALAKRLYPFNPGHRHRLRKFLSLALPLDEVAYIDVDTIMLQDFSNVFGRLEPGKAEFIVSCPSYDYIYNARHKHYDFLREAIWFNDGFFVTAPSLLSLKTFHDVIDQDEKIFHSVRQRGGLFAQPLTNFVVHRRGLKIAALPDCVPGASPESFYKAEKVTFSPEGPLDFVGNKIYFCHWAGVVGLPKRRVFDGLWHEFARQAAERLSDGVTSTPR